MVLGNWRSTCRRLKMDPYFSACTKVKSELIEDHKVNPEILKLLEANTGKILQHLPE
jgi:hypothetical protein